MAAGDKLVTLDGLKAVYQDVNGNIVDLKSALKIETTLSGWEKGSFDTTNGENYSDDTRIRNQTKIGVSTGVQGFTLADGYSTLMYAWDLSGNYVGAYKTDGTWTKTLSGWKSVTDFDLSTVPNYVIKFAMARVPSSADITADEGSNAILYSYTDDTLTKCGKAADAKKVGDEIADLKSEFNAVANLGSTSVFATDFQNGYRHERSNCALVVNSYYVIMKQPIQFYAGQVVSIASGYGLQFLIIDANPSNNGAYVCTRRSAPYTITADIQAYIEIRYEAGSTAISPSAAEEKVSITTTYPIVKTASDAYDRAMKIIKYVATTGNDTNSGNSSSEPYATIGKALTELADEIYIKPGTYAENLGEVNTGYRYRGVKIIGDHVIIQSNNTLHFRFCNVEIAGIYFDHQASSGEVAALHLLNCTGRVADCVADGAPGNGFRFDGSKITVERCIAMNCGIDGFNGHTITPGYETEVTLIDCVAHDCGDDGASIHESGKMYVFGGEYYNNVQDGLAPHDLCEFEALNVHCHNNGKGIEAIKDTLTEGQTPAVGRVIGCILNNNDTYGLDVKNYTVNTLGNAYVGNGSGNTNAQTGATINAFIAN